MFSAATSGRHARRYSMRFSIETPIAPVEKLMITSSPHSPRIASEIAWKSSTSYDGVPSGRRAWMWIIEPPSSTIRRASAAYSSGVYGIAGHWSRLATAPEIGHVRMTGSSRLMASGTSHFSLCPIAARGATSTQRRAPSPQLRLRVAERERVLVAGPRERQPPAPGSRQVHVRRPEIHLARDRAVALPRRDREPRERQRRLARNPQDLVRAVGQRRRGERVAEQHRGDVAVTADDVRHLRLGIREARPRPGRKDAAVDVAGLRLLLLLRSSAAGQRGQREDQTGTTPCRFHGRSTRLPSAI